MAPLLNRLAKNSIWLLLARLGSQGLAVLFTVGVARRLGGAGFGEYAFIAAAVFAGNVLTTFGTDMLLIRRLASGADARALSPALLLQLCLSALFIAGAWAAGGWIPQQSPEALAALRVYSLALIPLSFFTVFTAALRGSQRMGWYALLNAVIPALQVMGILLMPAGHDLVSLSVLLLAVQALAALMAGLIGAASLPGFWSLWRFAWPDITPFLKAAAPIALLGILGMLYQRLGVLMLSTMNGPAGTGIFSAAARAVEASKGAHVAVFTALYPAMAAARTDTSNGPDWARALRGTRVGLFAGAMLAATILFAFAAPLTDVLYGAGFAASAGVLRILAWTLLPFTISTYLTLACLAAGRERIVTRALTAGLLALALMNLLLIPVKGPAGAAWAALAAECIQAAVLLAHASELRVWITGESHELPNLS